MAQKLKTTKTGSTLSTKGMCYYFPGCFNEKEVRSVMTNKDAVKDYWFGGSNFDVPMCTISIVAVTNIDLSVIDTMKTMDDVNALLGAEEEEPALLD